MTADCLPVCFATFDGREIAIAHAGWRGLVNGVLEKTLDHFTLSSRNIMAWLGPAIGPCHFEVGEEVRQAFIDASSHGYRSETEQAFTSSERAGHWMADLYTLAMIRLVARGITAIHGGGACTICQNNQYFSFRKEGVTGRIATVIYRH
jgi:YfiH family protein